MKRTKPKSKRPHPKGFTLRSRKSSFKRGEGGNALEPKELLSNATVASASQRAFQLALLLCVAWIGLNTAKSIKILLSPPIPSKSQLPSIERTASLMPANGSWRFGESLQSISTSFATDPKVSPENSLAINEPTLKAFLDTDKNGDVTAAKLAMKAGNNWQVVELTDAEPSQAKANLLPLRSSKRICGRWSNDNRLLLEIVAINSQRQELLDAWRGAGWEIRHTVWGGHSSFSFLCVKDGQVVYAWSQQNENITSLLLSSSPDVALRQSNSNHGENS